MHLKSIKISGFKSFAEEVELILEPGITAIVGPNGCGKSNVSDAIRWVLGEQSARALRSTNMRDLLFNGGANFKPAPKATVTLSFTNITQNLSIETPEVEVCRQLTRDGESSYLINKTPCRLRDISELFMDTGVGVDAYSVMEQSKIDLILNVRPEERRFLFDEVAGITKYKHNRKTAIRKLEATKQNLVRINDLIQELERENISLKEQAEQAEHSQSLKEELKQLELGSAYRNYAQHAADYNELQKKLDAIQNEVSDANQHIQEADDKIESETHRRAELDDTISAAEEEIREINKKSESVERQIVLEKERQLNINQQRQRAIQALEERNTELTDLQSLKRQRIQEQKKLESSLKIEDSRLSARRQVLNELTASVEKTNQSIQNAQTEMQEITLELSKRDNRRSSIEDSVKNSQDSLDKLQENTETLKLELKAATDEREVVQSSATKIESEIIQITTEKEKIEEKIKETENALRKIDAEMRGYEEKLGSSTSLYRSLEQLQSTYEGYYAGVRAIMQAKEHYPDQFGGICGVVAELINTDTDFEVAIEVALGSRIQNVIAETAQDVRGGIDFLKKHRAGIVTFLPLDTLRRRTFSDDKLLDEPGVVGIAEELVEYDYIYEIAIQHLLGNTLVIEHLDDAIALTKRFRHNARLVTIEGELINTLGDITGGYNDKKKSGLLRRARELEGLQDKIVELQKIVSQKDRESKSYASIIADSQIVRQKLVGQLQDKQIEQTGIAKDIEQADNNISRLKSGLDALEKQNLELQEKFDSTREEYETLNTEIEEMTKQRTQKERWIQRVTEQMESDTRKLEDVTERCQSVEIFLAGQRQRIESMTEEISNFDEQHQQILKIIEEQQAIIDSDEQSKHDISEKIEAAQREFLQIEGDRAEAEAKLDELKEDREALLEEIENLQKDIRKTRNQFDRQNRNRRKLEVRTTQLEMQLKNITNRILDKYQVSIDELQKPNSEHDDIENEAKSSALASLELDEIDLMDRIEKLKAEISALGPVNLKAIEAHKEHQKRLDYQVEQRDDIVQAIHSTEQAIKKINQTSRDEFLKSFEIVKVNFQEVFTQLFGGGETELRLTDESDILESGIDIIARPPGKRPQSITQLSGGERSLVAIGLLFAVYKLKPSPFCVLDEVDAALDEANVLRFSNLINAYSENTQFVIITHNNRTTEIADVMYGVTMEQAGMSKILSHKFRE